MGVLCWGDGCACEIVDGCGCVEGIGAGMCVGLGGCLCSYIHATDSDYEPIIDRLVPTDYRLWRGQPISNTIYQCFAIPCILSIKCLCSSFSSEYIGYI